MENRPEPAFQSPTNDLTAEHQQASQPFIGEWNKLVSTTNWEKGEIISQWREALQASDAAASEYSDETWALLVGGVTGQHTGRLRRVYQRFCESHEKYQGLYWSHFQAAVEWDSAEMWLEGAVQNAWSVAQMRRRRWETLGKIEEDKPRDEEIVTSELDEDFEPAKNAEPQGSTSTGPSSFDQEHSGPRPEGPDFGDEQEGSSPPPSDSAAREVLEEKIEYVRPFENIGELPQDVTEAFEAYKLAILHHKAATWKEISCEEIIATLDSLKELALAPSPEGAPF